MCMQQTWLPLVLMLAPWMQSLVQYCAPVQFVQGVVLSSFAQSAIDCSCNAGVAKQVLSILSAWLVLVQISSRPLDYNAKRLQMYQALHMQSLKTQIILMCIVESEGRWIPLLP